MAFKRSSVRFRSAPPGKLLAVALLLLPGCRPGSGNPPSVAVPPVQEPTPSTGAVNLEGRILFDGPAPPPFTRPVSFDQEVCGSEPRVDPALQVDPVTRGIRGAVVTLTPVEPSGQQWDSLPDSATVSQLGCEFRPYITLIRPGARITFTNADPLLHDVHVIDSAGKGRHFPLPPRSRAEAVVEEADRWRLLCDLHPWAHGWVIATHAPFATASDPTGGYAFASVPPGRWRLDVWSERLADAQREVEIPADRTPVKLDVSLSLRAGSGPGSPPT
jgi:plastocyanin